jgi:hypothetical protein
MLIFHADISKNSYHLKIQEENVAEPTSDKHYEEKFHYPLWAVIKKHAEEKDISYSDALVEVLPEYQKSIRYRDEEYENSIARLRLKEMKELAEAEMKEGAFQEWESGVRTT